MLKMNCAIIDEEHYIEWSKKVNKLKYNNEVKKILYLPLKEMYKKHKNMCQGWNHL